MSTIQNYCDYHNLSFRQFLWHIFPEGIDFKTIFLWQSIFAFSNSFQSFTWIKIPAMWHCRSFDNRISLRLLWSDKRQTHGKHCAPHASPANRFCQSVVEFRRGILIDVILNESSFCRCVNKFCHMEGNSYFALHRVLSDSRGFCVHPYPKADPGGTCSVSFHFLLWITPFSRLRWPMTSSELLSSCTEAHLDAPQCLFLCVCACVSVSCWSRPQRNQSMARIDLSSRVSHPTHGSNVISR